jgi:hypothetical protein
MRLSSIYFGTIAGGIFLKRNQSLNLGNKRNSFRSCSEKDKEETKTRKNKQEKNTNAHLILCRIHVKHLLSLPLLKLAGLA